MSGAPETSGADRAGALCVLAGLPRIGPVRLRLLLNHHDPADAIRRLAIGGPLHPMVERSIGSDLAPIRSAATALPPVADAVALAAERCADAGVSVIAAADPGFPAVLANDIEPVSVLFVRGDLGALAARRVGMVGTRNATRGGLATAHDLGAELTDHGVAVVSGLARGIDAAAHAGSRHARTRHHLGQPVAFGQPVAVVGCGPDRPYPECNAELWEWVASDGVLISEYPPGARPDAWHFPKRNRIIAALSEVVVVVESRERGGSLITAREALDREAEVMAVPGSPRSRASAGTNSLLRDGATPVMSVDDVLVHLGIDHHRASVARHDPRPVADAAQQAVLDICREHGPCTLDAIVAATGLPISETALAAARLERSGRLAEAGGWFEELGSRLGRGDRPAPAVAPGPRPGSSPVVR